MKEIQRVIQIIVGVFAFYIAYNFWFGSGIFNGYFEPSVSEGNLGAGNADFLSQLLEIVFTILSTVGTVFIAVALRLIQWFATPFESAANRFAGNNEPDGEFHKVSNPRGKTKGFDVYAKVISQAIIDGDVDVIESIANKMHGEPFIKAQAIPRVQTEDLTPGGFPITEGDK